MTMNEDKSEIAFFDLETTVPSRVGQGHAILEFGAILVCPRKLIELENYSTLVCPRDLSLISDKSVRCNGITKDAVVSAPNFGEIADKVYDLLHGRIWAGHNILRFDCPRIREAFTEINRPPPEPKGTLDSLAILTQKFGRRAGDMKMASLATYFGLGQQTHRSLDDVRMNLEVLKYCATVLFLESSLPDIFTENSWVSPNATTRSRSNGKTHQDSPSPSKKNEHPIFKFMTPNTNEEEVSDQVNPTSSIPDPFNMVALSQQVESESILSEQTIQQETPTPTPTQFTSDFLELDEVSVPSISVLLIPFFRGTQKIQIVHNGAPLQLFSRQLKVRFGVNSKFLDFAGRPRLSIVVDALPSVCKVLDAIDNLSQKLSIDSGSNSEWRPIVIRKPGYFNTPTLRLLLPTVLDGSTTKLVTEIYQEESSSIQRLVFSKFDPMELESLLTSGIVVDAYFSLDAYDYQQKAGVRLVAKKLILRSN